MKKEFVLSLLMWFYFFGLVDLFITYYVLITYGNFEVSPLYHLGGRGLLISLKFFSSILFLYFTKITKSYFPLYVGLGLVVFICYRNVFNLFMLFN